MKIKHIEFMNDLAEVLQKYDIQIIEVDKKELGAIAVYFDDYYDRLVFESFENGIFKNVTTTQDYKTTFKETKP